jgi:RNA polymerase sigma-70 factor (ECF subfamily)
MKTSIGNVGYLIHHGVAALKLKWQAQERAEAHPQPQTGALVAA